MDKEFTLSWRAYHEHYACDRNGYKNMLEIMNGILNNPDTNGGEIHYDFWNPTYNRIIRIERKK